MYICNIIYNQPSGPIVWLSYCHTYSNIEWIVYFYSHIWWNLWWMLIVPWPTLFYTLTYFILHLDLHFTPWPTFEFYLQHQKLHEKKLLAMERKKSVEERLELQKREAEEAQRAIQQKNEKELRRASSFKDEVQNEQATVRTRYEIQGTTVYAEI